VAGKPVRAITKGMPNMDFQPAAKGFLLTETPVSNGDDLWFSDMVGGGIHCLHADGSVDAFLTDETMMGGIALNDDGAIICSGPKALTWFHPGTGKRGKLLDHAEGEKMRGINDIRADGRGGLLFGTVDHVDMLAGKPFFGRSTLYRLSADGTLTAISREHKFSNGLGVSPDGRHIYYNDSGVGTYVFPVAADGSIGEKRLLSDNGDCDGMAMDSEGGIWIAHMSVGGVSRLTPDGKLDRNIPLPDHHVTSMCFGGADMRDAFVTTALPNAGEVVFSGKVPAERPAVILKARSDIAGFPTAKTSFKLS